MVNALKLCVSLAIVAICFGCASKQEEAAAEDQAFNYRQMRTLQVHNEKDAAVGKQVVNHAQTTLGTPYVLGGSSRGGFDCSGLVMWAYNRVGVNLPRTAREQSTVGEKINRVEDMRAGDIVAFRHPKRGYHTGIYVGDGKFIHSPRKRSRVKISSLDDPYFSSTSLGARRISVAAGTTLVAKAESQLEDYLTSGSHKALARKNLQARASISKKAAKAKKASVSKISKKQNGKLAASKKTAAKTVAGKKQSLKPVASRATSISKKTVSKAPAKSLAGNNNRNRVSQTAKASPKKASGKAVSLLQRKSR